MFGLCVPFELAALCQTLVFFLHYPLLNHLYYRHSNILLKIPQDKSEKYLLPHNYLHSQKKPYSYSLNNDLVSNPLQYVLIIHLHFLFLFHSLIETSLCCCRLITCFTNLNLNPCSCFCCIT